MSLTLVLPPDCLLNMLHNNIAINKYFYKIILQLKNSYFIEKFLTSLGHLEVASGLDVCCICTEVDLRQRLTPWSKGLYKNDWGVGGREEYSINTIKVTVVISTTYFNMYT